MALFTKGIYHIDHLKAKIDLLIISQYMKIYNMTNKKAEKYLKSRYAEQYIGPGVYFIEAQIFVSVNEVCKALNLSRPTILKWCHSDTKIVTRKFNRITTYIEIHSLRNYLLYKQKQNFKMLYIN